MKAILTVGYQDLLLPMEEATKVMRILSQAIPVEKSYGPASKHEEQLKIQGRELTLNLELIKAKTRIMNADGEEAGDIEKMSRPKKSAEIPARLGNGKGNEKEMLRLT